MTTVEAIQILEKSRTSPGREREERDALALVLEIVRRSLNTRQRELLAENRDKVAPFTESFQ